MANEKVEFQVYNSMTRQKEVFIPKEPGKVKMYVCGVTSYDYSHIGHARAYVAFDLLYRYLKYLGYEVMYVRNFTDVDDKIIRRANELGEDPTALSGRYCQEFLKDMDDLQCLQPTHQPRVTEHMEQIKEMIAKIMANGCAYTINGDVYFSVDSFPEYGRLSGRKLEDNRAGERVEVDSRKKNPADFALWKSAKPGEPSWESPWGPGRPGWHIECSAMSAHYLTHSFDIHGGGMDLTFPHHENEIAQSCTACRESNISYWMHNGFVNIDDEKMSKSLGNFFTIREVTRLYHPLALRYFLLGNHYRSPVNYSISQIEIASESVFYIYQTLLDSEETLSAFQQGTETAKNAKGRVTPQAQECINKLRNELKTKLSDDLHTPTILNAALQEALKQMNSCLTILKKKQQKQQHLSASLSLTELLKEVKAVLDVLGLLAGSTSAEVLQQLKQRALKRAELTEEDVLHAIEERALARKNKDFARSDQIRTDLAAKGISLMDITGTTETAWRPCVRSIQEQPAAPAQPKKSAAAVQEKPVAPSQQKQPSAAPQQEQPAAAPAQQDHTTVPPQ
ncbi:cysteine--tRNA ligase 2, cytoplasmic isoform X2 [Solanum lycopersicum]|uniref:cysteine--tRNA ligase 2, cytoplasmic isoform X2 n=1 Tax=Solanum lycopersicum TaxID=4081 RepID=UPI0002766897|nr:cysteine--tRNA ligase 2, cytoplasmic isoform X2 [Solanum lycopersicum]